MITGLKILSGSDAKRRSTGLVNFRESKLKWLTEKKTAAEGNHRVVND